MSRFWSAVVHGLTPYVPGEQPKLDNLVKLNTNEHPYGPSPRALEAIRAATGDGLRLYPDPNADALKAALAKRHGVQPQQIFVGNGSDEVLAHAFMALLKHDAPILIPDISYSFYPVYCGLYQVEHVAIPLGERFEIRVDDYLRHAGKCGGIVIANPNAPTGCLLPLEAIERMLQASPDSVVVVDEAYIEFRDPGTPTALELIGEYENLAVSRTMSKAFAFAGARVGYLAANKGIIDCVRIVRMPYHLSAVTQAAALAAFEHTDEQLSRVAHLRETRNATSAWLKEQTYKGQPLEVAETQSNFILFGGHFDDRDRIFDELLKRGVLIRVVGPEGWMRVCMGTDEEMARFREALVEVLRIVEQG